MSDHATQATVHFNRQNELNEVNRVLEVLDADATLLKAIRETLSTQTTGRAPLALASFLGTTGVYVEYADHHRANLAHVRMRLEDASYEYRRSESTGESISINRDDFISLPVGAVHQALEDRDTMRLILGGWERYLGTQLRGEKVMLFDKFKSFLHSVTSEPANEHEGYIPDMMLLEMDHPSEYRVPLESESSDETLQIIWPILDAGDVRAEHGTSDTSEDDSDEAECEGTPSEAVILLPLISGDPKENTAAVEGAYDTWEELRIIWPVLDAEDLESYSNDNVSETNDSSYLSLDDNIQTDQFHLLSVDYNPTQALYPHEYNSSNILSSTQSEYFPTVNFYGNDDSYISSPDADTGDAIPGDPITTEQHANMRGMASPIDSLSVSDEEDSDLGEPFQLLSNPGYGSGEWYEGVRTMLDGQYVVIIDHSGEDDQYIE